jgi:hypothetical protein
MKRVGVYKISYEQMERFLELPEENVVVDIVEESQRQSNSILVKVSGPEMPYEVPEGEVIPWMPIDYLREKK